MRFSRAHAAPRPPSAPVPTCSTVTRGDSDLRRQGEKLWGFGGVNFKK